jgi:hypothetical protein
METESEIKKVSVWFDTGWKVISILFAVGSVIVSVVLAWVQISSNTMRIEEVEKDLLKEIQLQEDRSDKRFQRATEWNMERRKDFEKMDNRVMELEKENEFLKGKMSK